MEEKTITMQPLSGRRRAYDRVLRFLLYFCATLTCALLIFIIGYIFVRGLPHVTWEFLSTEPSYINDTIGILPNIANTIYIVVVTLIIILPLGVGAAVYLTEYAKNQKLVAAIEFATETLTGIPSIIFGLVGMLFFCELLGLQASLLAGSLTLVIATIPTIIRTTQESLKTVPQSYREASLGLGAGKWHMIRIMTLPEMATMALIEYHHDTRMAYRIYFAAIPCLAYGCIEFLNSGNDNLGVAMQTFYQLVRIVRTVNGSRFKGFIFRLCLCIKVMAVDNEHYLIYII